MGASGSVRTTQRHLFPLSKRDNVINCELTLFGNMCITFGAVPQLPSLTCAALHDAPSKMPPPSAPVNSVSEAIEWLAGEAQRIVGALAVPMQDGTLAFPPQVGLGYDAFWLRNYAYTLEGCGGSPCPTKN